MQVRRQGKDANASDETPALLEKQLSTLWEGQRFPREALLLPDGGLLGVVYRGRPGAGAGPDFRDATTSLPSGELLHGDVELHVRASDFRRHGHHQDPNYNQVILHVVFHHDGGATLLESGREVLTLGLAPWVATRRSQIESWLRQPALWREPCHEAVAKLGVDEIGRRLLLMGQRRLRQKEQALKTRAEREGFENSVLRELIEAVGYGPNRLNFRRLGAFCCWDEVRAEPALALERATKAAAISFEKQTRPGAGAQERLEGVTILLDRLRAKGPDQLSAALFELSAGPAAELVEFLSVKIGERTLIGIDRAVEIAVNVVLPAALLKGGEEGAVFALYEDLPEPASYGLTSFLQGILRRQDSSLVKGAARRQGLLLLQKEYCGQGHCGACPLSS